MINKQYFVYVNHYDEVKSYCLKVEYEGDEYIEVFDFIKKKSKTFKIENILSRENTIEDAEELALSTDTVLLRKFLVGCKG